MVCYTFTERECKLFQPAYDYLGSQSVSITNTTCLPWDMFPETEEFYFHDMPSVMKRKNYCRNPGLDGRLSTTLHNNDAWCIIDVNGTIEQCDIPSCSEYICLWYFYT